MFRFSFCATLVFGVCFLFPGGLRGENWPGFRGPRGDGTSLEKNVPVRWNGSTGENVVWKVPVPGWGYASPVVWEDRIFLVTCFEDREERVLLCLDRADGKILWQKVVIRSPLEKKHKLNSYASSTVATDGELVFVSFLEADLGLDQLTGKPPKTPTPGNMVVAAYDFDGNQRWIVRPGRFSSVHGYCSSPLLFKNLVIVNGDHDGDSYLVALEQSTGETVWKKTRPNKTRSYCVPIIREIDGRTQMILSGTLCVTSYDPHDASLHWIIDGPTEQYVASLVYNGKLLFLTAGFPEHHILAIRPDGHGNVTDTHIVWRTTKGCAYVPSPIVEGEYFLVVSDSGIGTCFVGETGEPAWVKRIGPHFSTSLVSAEGLVYFLCDDGTMTVVRPGKEYDVVATNDLGEECFASPAISRSQMFIRGTQHLFCIGQSSPGTP